MIFLALIVGALATTPLQPALHKMNPLLTMRCTRLLAEHLGPLELIRLIFDHMGNAPDQATIEEVWKFNSDEIWQVLRHSEVAFISFGRRSRLGDACRRAVATLGSLTWKFKTSHPLWRFLPRMHRERFADLFTEGPDFEIRRIHGREPNDSWTRFFEFKQISRFLTELPAAPGKMRRQRSEHHAYDEYTMIGASVFCRDYDDGSPLFIDVRTGRSLYYKEGEHGKMYWLPDQRFVVTKRDEGCLELLHAEAEVPLECLGYFAFMRFDGECVYILIGDGNVIKQSTRPHGYLDDKIIKSEAEMNDATFLRFPENVEHVFIPCTRNEGGEIANFIACASRQMPEIFDSFRSISVDVLARATLARGSHARQVQLRDILTLIDQNEMDLAWSRIVSFMRGIKYNQIRSFVQGVIMGDKDALNCRIADLGLALVANDWGFDNWE